MQKRHFLFAIFMLLFVSIEAQATEVAVTAINSYIDTISGLIGGKITIITITLVMIFSGILAWKNASIAPLGWGGAASVVIGGSGSIADSMKNLIIN